MPLEKLQKTVLVASSWKEFPRCGFPIGSKPTIHYVWKGETTGSRKIKKVFVPSDDPDEPYAVEYYLRKFEEILRETPIKIHPVEQLGLLDLFTGMMI